MWYWVLAVLSSIIVLLGVGGLLRALHLGRLPLFGIVLILVGAILLWAAVRGLRRRSRAR